jgi:hypothetical protein
MTDTFAPYHCEEWSSWSTIFFTIPFDNDVSPSLSAMSAEMEHSINFHIGFYKPFCYSSAAAAAAAAVPLSWNIRLSRLVRILFLCTIPLTPGSQSQHLQASTTTFPSK